MRRVSRDTRRLVFLFTALLLIGGSSVGASAASAAEKTIEATFPPKWEPRTTNASVGDVILWKIGNGNHGVRITNWADVKDHVEVVTVEGQQPFNATNGRNDDPTDTAGKVLLQLKIKSPPEGSGEIQVNSIVHGNAMKGTVSVSRFPNVTLKTQDGKEVRFYDDLVKDKISIINFMYIQCENCEQGTKNLSEIQKGFLADDIGREVNIYSISVKPDDTPDKLKAYAEKFKAKPGWSFLTGTSEHTSALQDALGLSGLSPEIRAKLRSPKGRVAETAKKLHSGQLAIVDDVHKRKVSHASVFDSAAQILEKIKRPR
jgi:cytochrome oxidase Cu insertion factor (SCO1/SenC/PrrC family)